MTIGEMEQLSLIDEVCSDKGFSYTIEVEMGIGVRTTIFISENHKLIFGGLDYNFERSLSRALEVLHSMRVE